MPPPSEPRILRMNLRAEWHRADASSAVQNAIQITANIWGNNAALAFYRAVAVDAGAQLERLLS